MKLKLSILFAMVLTTGCATSIKTTKDMTNTGLKYPLPLNQLQLTVTKTDSFPEEVIFKATEILNFDTNSVNVEDSVTRMMDKCYFKGKPSQTHKLEKIEILRLADWQNAHTIAVDPRMLSTGSLSITRNELGWLKSVNIDSDGKADDVLKTAFNLVGTISGFTSVGGGIPDNFPSLVEASDIELGNWRSYLEIKSVSSNVAFRAIATDCASARLDLLKHFGVLEFLQDSTSYLSELAVFHDIINKELFTSSNLIKDNINTVDKELVDLNVLLSKATTTTDITDLQQQIRTKKLAMTYFQNQANAKAASLANAENNIKKLYGIKPAKKEKIIKTFDIDKLESLDVTSLTNDVNSLDEFHKAIKNLGIAIKLERATTWPKNDGGVTIEAADTDDSESYIAYRDPETFIAKIYTKNIREGAAETWDLVKSEPIQLISKTSPTGYLEFEASVWSKRTMGLTFNNQGVLTEVNYTNESGAENIANALNDGVSNYIDKYKSAQTAKLEINAAQRTEKTALLQFEIDQLTKQKELLTARTALSTATSETSLELQQLEQQITLLETQKRLLEAQVGLDTTELTSSLTVDNSVLASQLANLQAQAALADQEAGSDILSNHIMTLSGIAQLQQQLLTANGDEEVSQIQTSIKQLEIQLNVLLKELELRGLIQAN